MPAIRRALSGAGKLVLAAPPGSGKTTLVPLALLDQPWLKGKKILMLEPRRLAARASARRMAQLLAEESGQTVGYQIRFERKISARTRIEVVTEGILTRRLQSDPALEDVGLLIFDEFHERSLQADLALALALDVRTGLRDDLRLLIMSATLDTAALSRLLGDAPVITGQGRSYPVALRYLERPTDSGLVPTLVKGVQRALEADSGDVLAFLPGTGEIRRAEAALREQLPTGIGLYPLYGELSRADQDHALLPRPGERRVVLATSIAETSLTIEGIGAVVDSGWSRRPRFDPNTGLTRLQTVRVSLASAEQRAGRAGRLGPGVCYRLWTLTEQSRLPAQHTAELQEADLAPLVLELALWGVTDPLQLQWLEPPPVGAYAQAQDLLRRLDALDEAGRITPVGRRMGGLALHPRLAHMLLNAAGQDQLALDLAGLLSERDILKRQPGVPRSIDIEERLQQLQAWRNGGGRASQSAMLDSGACRRIDQAIKQWRRLLRSEGEPCGDPISPGGLLSLAYPDRIARRRPGSTGRYLLSSGRGVVLPEGDPLMRHDYLLVAALDAGDREGRVFLAAAITADEIRSTQTAHLAWLRRVAWDASTQSVVAREEERLGAIVLSIKPTDNPDPEATVQAMIAGIRQMGLDVLPWSRELLQWRERVNSLRHWQPDAGWPDLSDATLCDSLESWLGPWLAGISRRDHLKRLDLAAILQSGLSWDLRQQIERLAPASLEMPSGSRKRLRYQAGELPVLAVKLQELFGLRQTPRVCEGRVDVVLHLLSPAQRPIQVTRDLAGFWERTYADVKKELKGRYPKHYWPDDPLSATPTARVRPNRDK